MSNPVWPIGLPTSARMAGYGEAQQADVIETPMDIGDPKRRSRSSLIKYTLTCTLRFTSAQVDTFQSWFANTIGQGALRFDAFPHPRTKATLNNVRLISVGAVTALSDLTFDQPVVLEYRA